jgi:regulator of protease activity HflC (stomatin/prohibitin superfamily)
MFGTRFIKTQPTTYVLKYVNGQLKSEGQGLAFFYFAPTTSLVAIPMESVDVPFIFKQGTGDFQEVDIQGQVTYRVVDPKKLAQLLNFTLANNGLNYVSNDPEKLPPRLINLIHVLMQSIISKSSLRETLNATDSLVTAVKAGLVGSPEVTELGLEVLGLSILSIKPKPETARALEADVRELLLRKADEAIYARRNAAVEQERAIRENELNTEIAVENKKRQIREAQMEAERSVQEKQQQILEAEMQGKIALEKQNKELVVLASENLRCEADAKVYTLTATLQALAGVDTKILQALASMGMNPAQLVALAFHDLAASAERIGQLNVSPDLLRELLQHSPEDFSSKSTQQSAKKS